MRSKKCTWLATSAWWGGRWLTSANPFKMKALPLGIGKFLGGVWFVFGVWKHILLGEIIDQDTCWAKEKEYYKKKAPTEEKDKLRPEFRDWSKEDWTEVHRNRIPARWILNTCQYAFWILKCIFLYLSQACLHSRVCHRINFQNHLRGHNCWKA